MPSSPRANLSRRSSGVEPMRRAGTDHARFVRGSVSIGKRLRSARDVCEIGEGKLPRSHSIIADWRAHVPKARKPGYDQALQILRSHSFDVAPFTGVAKVRW